LVFLITETGDADVGIELEDGVAAAGSKYVEILAGAGADSS